MFTILIFLLILGLLIFVHEFGHFFAAKRSGAAVDEFGFGFPPRLWSIRRGETRYSLNLIPLGGFVKVRGEDSATSEAGSFSTLSLGRRAWVLASGVFMNVFLALTLFFIGFVVGTPTALPDELPSGAIVRDKNLQIVTVVENSPAGKSGMLPGDVLVEIDGQPQSSLEDVQDYNNSRSGEEEMVLVQRGKTTMTVRVTPQVLPTSEGRAVWGVELLETGIVRFPIHQAIVRAVTVTATMLWNIVQAFGDLLRQLFSTQTLPQDVTGPIGIAVLTGRVVDLGLLHVIQFTALLSLNLAIINALPFPALDGGRLLFLLIELISRKRVNAKVERIVHATGFAILLLLITAITFRDVGRFGGNIARFFQGFTLE